MSNLSLITEQKLQTKLSPAQIQVMRLLELPSIELRQRINEELQANPALEEGADPNTLNDNAGDKEEEDEYVNPLKNNDFDYDDYVDDDEKLDYNPYSSASSNTHTDIPIVNSTTLMEHLKAQVYLTKMDKPQRHIAKWVLGNIDDDGFLRRTVEQLVDDIAFQENLTVSDQEMTDIVNQIKQFDPAGVAAMDVQECLINQLRQKKSTPSIDLAIHILSSLFEAYTKHHYEKIIQRLNISEQELKDAITEIQRLNRKPANAFSGNTYENHKSTIIPDFMIENRDGELYLSLNTGDIPELHISPEYNDMLAAYSGKKANNSKANETVHFLKEKIDSANWFIHAIRQRNETLMRTMEAILKVQREFFLEGDETFLKPMILQNIADITGYDISTISRVSNSKYVQTDFGIYPLKHFFSESLTTDNGEEVSTREVKKILQEEVDKEDKSNPLTDDMLVQVLNKHGYRIARRTIAKYREQLNIPVARLRKVL